MTSLRQTREALRDFPANSQRIFGFHEGAKMKAGGQGNTAFEEDFNPEVHEPHMINVFSTWADVVEHDQVAVTIPERPLHANIVIHQPASTGLDKRFNYGENRRWLGRVVGREIEDAIKSTGLTNRVWIYGVGEAADELRDPRAKLFRTSGEPREDAEVIAELARGRLTFLLSPFLHLPLEQTVEENRSVNYPAMVGVKINVPADLGLGSGNGVLPTNKKGGEVDTNNPLDLQISNGSMARLHDRIIDHFEHIDRTNIAMASVVLARESELGFVVEDADAQIAAAIRSLTDNKL